MFESRGSPASGGISDVLIRTYTGDATGSREIDLGLAYDVVTIRQTSGNRNWNDQHLVLAWAQGAYYSTVHCPASAMALHGGGVNVDARFQGFIPDSTRVMLGVQGPQLDGSNALGVTYEIVAWRFTNPRG